MQVEHAPTCRVVGAALHYLTLCALAWLALAANAVLQRAAPAQGGDAGDGGKAAAVAAAAAGGGGGQVDILGGGKKAAASGGKGDEDEDDDSSPPALLTRYLLGWGLPIAVVVACLVADSSAYGLVRKKIICSFLTNC